LIRGLTAHIPWGMMALAVLLAASACQRRADNVTLRLQHEPGVLTTHLQLSRGSVRVNRNDSLVSNQYVESKTKIENLVLSVNPDDSVARLAVTLTASGMNEKPDDSAGTADSTDNWKNAVEYIEYMRPNGQLVDIDFESERKSSRPEYIRQYYEQAFPVFPAQPVTVGYTWTQTTRVTLDEGPVDASTKYTVKSLVKEQGYNCAVVEYSGLCVIPLEPTPAGDTVSCTRLVSGVGRINADGVMYFAYEKGFVVHERERWCLRGDRVQVTKADDTLRTQVEVDYDVDISLVSRTQTGGDDAASERQESP